MDCPVKPGNDGKTKRHAPACPGHPSSIGGGASYLSLMPRAVPPRPSGFEYRPDFLTASEERRLIAAVEPLPFKEFDFHGYKGKRRVVSFGWRYDYEDRGLQEAAPIPDFLLAVRDRAAAFAGISSADLQHALVTEYRPGAPIGWHRDKAVFGDVIGISLASPCTLRFRRKQGTAWERWSILAEPRAAYLLRGAARSEWQHSIPPVEQLRYSITFRSLGQPSAH